MSSLVGRWRSAPHSWVSVASLAVTAWLALGCDAAQPTPMVPSDECYWGAQFADCGGNGTPRLACEAVGRGCRWFTGGTVAEGYLAWPCADGRICCEDGPDASFPDGLDLSAASFLSANGAEPWTRERALALDVNVDPEVSGELALRCEQGGQVVDDVRPCRPPNTGTTETMNRYSVRATMRDTLSVSVTQTDGFVGVSLFVEVVAGDAPDQLRARVCQLTSSDGIAVSCEPTDYTSPPCATEGSVRLSAVPSRFQSDLAGVVVAGDVVFPSGLAVSFTVPL